MKSWLQLERETDLSKKRNVISSTKIHLSWTKSISRGVKNGLYNSTLDITAL
jgi:hypothetical protein